MRRIISMAVAVVFAVLGFGMAMLNTAPVEINYYYGTWSVPLALLVGVAVSLGMAIGLLVNLVSVLRLKRRIAKAERQAAGSVQQGAAARLVPVKSVL